MKIHYLKTWTEHFKYLKSGAKTFEIRKNDRDYKVGDILVCEEYYPKDDLFTGDMCCFHITHMLTDQPFVPPDYVALSIKPIPIKLVEYIESKEESI